MTGLTLGLLEVGGVTPEEVGVLELGGTLLPGGVTLLASVPKLGVLEFGALTLEALLTLERATGVTLLGGCNAVELEKLLLVVGLLEVGVWLVDGV